MRNKTNSSHRPTRQHVLEVRVMSPRIAWLGFLKFLGMATKLCLLLAVLGGAGWGIWRVIERAFYQNPDFRLQVVDLNPNPIIDEMGIVRLLGIQLTDTPNLFDLNVSEASRKLNDMPGIVRAKVERHLPGTLMVRVECRAPKAWVAYTNDKPDDVRHIDGLLLDSNGTAYPCPERQFEMAKNLPIVVLKPRPDHALVVGKPVTHPEISHCLKLLSSAELADPQAAHWIQTIRQSNDWSLSLVTQDGTTATFGLDDHERQIASLRAALEHAAGKGYLIDTINLIPKFNVPITMRPLDATPRAIPISIHPSTDRRANAAGSVTSRN